MTGWPDVDAWCRRLPDARHGEAHDGLPAWYAGRHQFARLRVDATGRELLQVWTDEMDTEAALADRRADFPVVHTFRFRVTMWGDLARLDPREVVELLLDSHAVRGGARRASRVDRAAFLGGRDGARDTIGTPPAPHPVAHPAPHLPTT